MYYYFRCFLIFSYLIAVELISLLTCVLVYASRPFVSSSHNPPLLQVAFDKYVNLALKSFLQVGNQRMDDRKQQLPEMLIFVTKQNILYICLLSVYRMSWIVMSVTDIYNLGSEILYQKNAHNYKLHNRKIHNNK